MMVWREKMRGEILKVLQRHDVFSTMDAVASDITDALLSSDERAGYAVVPNEPTERQIGDGMNAPDGAPNSVVTDWLDVPARNDEAWDAIGGYPKGQHPSYASIDWYHHVVATIYKAMIKAAAKQ